MLVWIVQDQEHLQTLYDQERPSRSKESRGWLGHWRWWGRAGRRRYCAGNWGLSWTEWCLPTLLLIQRMLKQSPSSSILLPDVFTPPSHLPRGTALERKPCPGTHSCTLTQMPTRRFKASWWVPKMVRRQARCAPIFTKGKRILALLTVKTCYIREALLWWSFSQFYLGNRILQLPESQRRNI